jgi:hypothetical protein
MIIFERETEVGRCTCEPGLAAGLYFAEPDYATVCAHTVASLYGHMGLLKIEQHCLLRCGDELPEQPWIPPEITIEPAVESKRQMRKLAEAAHNQFIARVQDQFPREYWPATEPASPQTARVHSGLLTGSG